MASFFEKLKKGMGIEEGELSSPTRTSVEGEEESQAVKKVPKRKRISVSQKEPMKKPRKLEIKKPLMEEEPEEEEEPMITESPVENEEEAKEEILMEKVGEKTKEVWEKEKEEGGAMRTKSSSSPSSSIKEEWPTFSEAAEGQLAIDVYQTEGDLVVQSAIAGVRPENLDIVLEKDILSIKGLREKPFNEEGDYFSQECYWGPFSREIILPAEVDPNQAKAQMKEGVLTIRIPKILREKKRKVVVTS